MKPFTSKHCTPFSMGTPLRQEVNAITGRTQEEQYAANMAEKQKQVNNKDLYTSYMKARAAKKAWEDSDPENFLREYPQQQQLDSLRTAYKKAK